MSNGNYDLDDPKKVTMFRDVDKMPVPDIGTPLVNQVHIEG